MSDSKNTGFGISKTWIVGLVVVIILVGFGLVFFSINQSLQPAYKPEDPIDALATSQDDCVTCHREETPGIVQQYTTSTMAAAEVSCRDCHEVEDDYPMAVEHEGA
ncbi:MAG: hypothetical protein MUO54_06740, partial [Anaerolineales bacterium]|nr:hypothetical protein [Anaerolineales bacterium]